jgi:hypothetical protein
VTPAPIKRTGPSAQRRQDHRLGQELGSDVPVRGSWVDTPWFHRRTKEELVDFDGRPLFTTRKALTQPFELPNALAVGLGK